MNEKRWDRLLLSGWTLWTLIVFLPRLGLKIVPLSTFWQIENFSQWIPYREFLAGMLERGLFPAWAPQISCGWPFMAFPQTGVYYPFLLLFTPLSWETALTLELLMIIWLGGIFYYGLLRRLGLPPWVTWFVVLISIGGPAYYETAAYLANGRSMSWFLWMCYAIVGLSRERRRWRDFVSLVLGMVLCLFGGNLEFLLWGCTFLAAAGFYLAWSRGKFGSVLVMAGGAVAGLLLAAGTLLPLMEFMPHSVRALGITFDLFAEISSMWIILLLALFPFIPSSHGGFEATNLYFGWSVLFLAGYAVYRLRRKTWPALLALFWSLLVVISPVFFLKLLFHLPVYQNFLVHYAAMIITYTLLYSLSGFGLKELLAGWPHNRRALFGLAAVCVLLAAASLLIHDWVRIPVFLALAVGVGLLARQPNAAARTVFLLVLAIGFVEITVWAAWCKPRHRSADFAVAPAAAEVLSRPEQERFWVLSNWGYFDPALHANMGLRLDPTLPGSSSPAFFWRVSAMDMGRLLDQVAPGFLDLQDGKLNNVHRELLTLPPTVTPKTLPLLSLMNVGKIISRGFQLDLPQLELIRQEPGIWVYRNRTVLPRVFLVRELVSVPEAKAALERVASGAVDFSRQAVAVHDRLEPCADPVPARWEVTTTLPGLWELQADAGHCAAWLVLSESRMPGWRAWVDGEETKIEPTNFAFMGLSVPAGSHRLRLAYHPWSGRIGLFYTLAGFGFLAAMWVMKRGAVSHAPSSNQS